VPRKSDPRRKQQFEQAIIDHVRRHGFADLSLRTLASALGVSTFALVYHFGSKGGVLAVAHNAVRRHHQRMFREWMGVPGASPPALMKRYWDWWVSRPDREDARLSFEVMGTALRDPSKFPHVAEAARTWQEIVTESGIQYGLEEPDAEAVASLVVATVIGLEIDLLTTGEEQRTTRALYAAADAMEAYVSRRLPVPR
jgi:AcrR family transcriptional regulator